MKNSIQIIAIALLSFTNAFSSNGIIKNEKLNNAIYPVAKTVSFANANLIQTELGDLKKVALTSEDHIATDSKIIEKAASINNNMFVTYFDASLINNEFDLKKSDITKEEKINADLKTTESSYTSSTKSVFVTYANASNIDFEIQTLKASKLSIENMITADSKITEAESKSVKTAPYKNKNQKLNITKTIKF
jgi:hypothetical protein